MTLRTKQVATVVVLALALIMSLAAFVPAAQKDTVDWLVTKKLTLQEQGAFFSSVLNMDANAIENIGAAGTDFGSDGSLTTAAGITISDGNGVIADFARIVAQTSLTVTDATAFTPTGSYQPITAAGTVTPTLATSGYTAGDMLYIVNNSAQSIVIQDTGNQVLASSYTMGQYDTLTLRFDGTRWVEMGRSNN